LEIEVGARIVVHTPDQLEFRGRLVEYRDGIGGKKTAVVRLDTGWLTSYPVSLVRPEEPRKTDAR
jgi:hypothetical protein